MSLGDFFLGLLSPFVASGLLVLGARMLFARGSSQPSINLAIPLTILGLSLVAVVLFWGTRRSLSYGLLAAILVGVIVTGVYMAGHGASGGAVPPPR
jgi:hypothetical protein